MEVIVFLLLIFLSFLEGSITSLPLAVLCLLTLAAHTKSPSVYIYALFSGCILDILSARTLGVTGLFFIAVLFVIFLYQRKYEIDSYVFVFFSSIIVSVCNFFLFGGNHLLMHVVISILFAETVFLLWKVLFLKSHSSTYT